MTDQPPRSATPAPSIESAEEFAHRLIRQRDAVIESKARVDERARAIEENRRLWSVLYAAQRVVGNWAGGMSPDHVSWHAAMNHLQDVVRIALATPEGGRAADQPACCWPHCERGSGTERCPNPLTADCAPDQERGS